jgi:hypothetical protein
MSIFFCNFCVVDLMEMMLVRTIESETSKEYAALLERNRLELDVLQKISRRILKFVRCGYPRCTAVAWYLVFGNICLSFNDDAVVLQCKSCGLALCKEHGCFEVLGDTSSCIDCQLQGGLVRKAGDRGKWLSNLSKRLLVLLDCEIEQVTRDNCLRRLDHQKTQISRIRDCSRDVLDIRTWRCKYQECASMFCVSRYKGKTWSENCKRIDECCSCDSTYCDLHYEYDYEQSGLVCRKFNEQEIALQQF